MGTERRRGGDDGPDHGDSSDRGASSHRGASADGDESCDASDATGRVHVRRLDVLDTLRWSWEVLRNRRELLVAALAVNLLSVVAAFGVTRPSPSAELVVADWVNWLYFVQFLATLVVAGAVYLTAADAVANRSRPLKRHLVAATKRLPALVVAAIVMGLLVVLSLIPALAVAVMDWANVGVGLLLTFVLALVGVYAFLRLLLAYPACVIDRKGPVVSARASWLAGTGIVGKVFIVAVVYVLAVWGVYVISNITSSVVSSQLGHWYVVASAVVSAAFGTVFLPVFSLALAHLYLEGSRNR